MEQDKAKAMEYNILKRITIMYHASITITYKKEKVIRTGYNDRNFEILTKCMYTLVL